MLHRFRSRHINHAQGFSAVSFHLLRVKHSAATIILVQICPLLERSSTTAVATDDLFGQPAGAIAVDPAVLFGAAGAVKGFSP